MSNLKPTRKKDNDVIKRLSEFVKNASYIEPELFEKYGVKRGLRNSDHTGVLVGLTNIGDVVGYNKEGERFIPIDGQLIYRGINIVDLVKGTQQQKRHGFDEIVYLLLSGQLPNQQELKKFMNYMGRS